MNRLELKIPPLAAAAVVAAAMWAAYRYVPTAGFELPFRQLLFAITMPAAALIAGFAIQTFRAAETTVNPVDPDAAEKLVTTGLFRVSRNPMYLGLLLLLVALACVLCNLAALAFLPSFVGYMTLFQILPEERALLADFGADYTAYKEAVRRWV